MALIKKTTNFFLSLIVGSCAALHFASFAQSIHVHKDVHKDKKASAVTTVVVAIPSDSFSGTELSLYRAGYERELLKKFCGRVTAVKCIAKVVEEDPRTTPLLNLSGSPAGIDAFIWGSEVRMNEKAMDAALLDALESLAVTGELAQFKRRFMKIDRAWPKPLFVGTDVNTIEQAKSLCVNIRAKCTFISGKDFAGLAKRFDAGELQWVAHNQSWLFESKDLEDRLTTAIEDIEKSMKSRDKGEEFNKKSQ